MNNNYNADLLVNENSIIASKFPEYCSSTMQKNECFLLLEDTIYKKEGVYNHIYDIDVSNIGDVASGIENSSTINANLFIRVVYSTYFATDLFRYNIVYGNKNSNSYYVPKLYVTKEEYTDSIKFKIYIDAPHYNIVFGIKPNLVYPKMCNSFICTSTKRYSTNELDNVIETISDFTSKARDIIPLVTDMYNVGKKGSAFFSGFFSGGLKIPLMDDNTAKRNIGNLGKANGLIYYSTTKNKLLIYLNNNVYDTMGTLVEQNFIQS